MIDNLLRRFPALLMARRNLTRANIRSALAIIGIVIGVIAIASLGMLGTSLQDSAQGSLGEIGNEVVVSPAFDSGVETLDDRDVRSIRRSAGESAVVPIKSDNLRLEHGSDERIVSTYGIDDPGTMWTARDGTIPDQLRGGAVIGSDLADELDISAGNSIEVEGSTYRVQAVLDRQSDFSPVTPNTAIILPEEALPADEYDQVMVVAESGSAANESAASIDDALNDRETVVDVFELREFTEEIDDFFGLLNWFLIGIGSISLLVAGVSILNVMLMSAIERREEIGVLRAVGFRKRDVLLVMLSEAALLGIIGGVIGLTLSIGVGALLNHVMVGDWTVTFTAQNLLYLGLAFSFGIVTSVVSGLYPAWKAASERPVEALRT